ncbi:hypothetical protein ACQP08_17610 [Micromonospora zamorensis]
MARRSRWGCGYRTPAVATLAGLGVLLAALRLTRRQEPAKADATLVDTAA